MKDARFFLIALLLFATMPLTAQKKAKPRIKEDAHGVATYVSQGNEGILDVKKKALKKAQLNAIEAAFGTGLIATTSSSSSVNNGKSTNSFYENTNAEVRGIWLEDKQAPKFEILCDDPLTYKVEVWGRVQEITEAKIDTYCKIYNYKDQETLEFQQTALRETSHVFLDFQSPITGNLVVYLLDETEQKAYLMLPYKNDDRPSYTVDKGEIVSFFKHAFKGKSTRMRLTTQKEVDYFQLYIIFSPNTIYSNFEEKGEGTKLNTMGITKFHHWLSSAKNADRDMVVIQKTITLYNQTFK